MSPLVLPFSSTSSYDYKNAHSELRPLTLFTLTHKPQGRPLIEGGLQVTNSTSKSENVLAIMLLSLPSNHKRCSCSQTVKESVCFHLLHR